MSAAGQIISPQGSNETAATMLPGKWLLCATEHDFVGYRILGELHAGHYSARVYGSDGMATHHVILTLNRVAQGKLFKKKSAWEAACSREIGRIIRLVEVSGYDGAGREGFAAGTFARANADHRWEHPRIFHPLANAPAADWEAWDRRLGPQPIGKPNEFCHPAHIAAWERRNKPAKPLGRGSRPARAGRSTPAN